MAMVHRAWSVRVKCNDAFRYDDSQSCADQESGAQNGQVSHFVLGKKIQQLDEFTRRDLVVKKRDAYFWKREGKWHKTCHERANEHGNAQEQEHSNAFHLEQSDALTVLLRSLSSEQVIYLKKKKYIYFKSGLDRMTTTKICIQSDNLRFHDCIATRGDIRYKE